MKVLYIESKLKNTEFNLAPQELKKLPSKLFLAYSIQYQDLAQTLKKQLQSKGITITNTQQVLGCSKVKTKNPILLIGSGRFHAINLYLQSPEIYLLEGTKITKIPKEEINQLKAKRKTALIKFLNADKIGILVTTKPGQENINKAIALKEKLKKKDKEAYIFITNNIDIAQFENFNIQSWVNTACSGLANDNANIINIAELPQP